MEDDDVKMPGDAIVHVAMKAAHWQLVVNLLQEHPYKLVFGVIRQIHGQCLAAAQRLDEPLPELLPRGNGIDHEGERQTG